MHSNKLIFALLAFWSITVSAGTPAPLSPLVWEVKVERAADVLFRYTRFNTESEYPCMRFETIEPTSNKVLQTKDYCNVTLPFLNNTIIDVRNEVQLIDYMDLELTGNTFTFIIDLILKEQASFLLSCSLNIDGDIMSEVDCQNKY
ncbi:MAG: hypothetical protein ACI9NY_002350 [Kiritimatiellia bacterium]|jgi:hypothetical protein